MLTYDFRLPPGPRTVEYALLAEDLGFRAVWCPEIPAFGPDIWVTLARIAEKTADSGDVARSFRDHVARCSDMMSPA